MVDFSNWLVFDTTIPYGDRIFYKKDTAKIILYKDHFRIKEFFITENLELLALDVMIEEKQMSEVKKFFEKAILDDYALLDEPKN